MMLFKVDKNNKVLLHPECVKLCPEFNVLSQEEIVFIVLVYDYNSPFSQLIEEERIRRAMFHIWNDNKLDLLGKQKIKNAISAYKGFQYNPKIEIVNTYQKKISMLLEELEGLSSGELIKKNMEATSRLRAGIRELEQEIIESYQEEGTLMAGAELSFLEKIQKNMEYYKSVIKKK